VDVIKLYWRPGCELCNVVREELEKAGFEWEEINIVENEDILNLYRHEIPVVEAPWGRWLYREKEKIPLLTWLIKRDQG
jgi:flavorubredoxin